MRVLGPIVQISALSVLDAGKQLTLSDAIAPQRVGHDHSRPIWQAFRKPPEEALRGVSIAPGLNEDVERNAILIDGAPEIMLHALDPDEDLASRAEESHLRALLEPYVTLSSHTAPDVRSSTCTKRQCAKRFGLARRTRASQSLARLGFRRRRLNLSHAQRTRTASTRFSVQYSADR